MSTIRSNSDLEAPSEVRKQISALGETFLAALKQHDNLCLVDYLDCVDRRWRKHLLDELLRIAHQELRAAGVSAAQQAILDANPQLRDELQGLAPAGGETATVSMFRDEHSTDKTSVLSVRCPHCQHMVELVVDASLVEIECENCGGSFSLANDVLDTRAAAAITQLAHFELIERLGVGAFGTVWKARDTLLQRTVAIKIPRRAELDPLSIEKFLREARAAAQLHHPNIIRTHEVGRYKDTLYIVNEYVRGVPLSIMMSDHRLGVRESVLMVVKVADSLEHAHGAGVIHRDIKPSNILIDDHGEPHLMDFGLAKRRDNEITITAEGAILGTPAYMSPEQARGEAHRVDGRSDVYSVGVILFQLLTGELPFRGTTRMLLQKVINDDPPGPRSLDSRLPRELDTICLKCMEKEPARRYGTAGELAADMRRYLAGQPIAAVRVGRLGRAIRWARRNSAVAALLTATITTLLAAAIVSSYLGWRAHVSAVRADREAAAVTNALYDSLAQEIRLTREVRTQGYGAKVRRLVDRAQALNAKHFDKDELRRQLVLSMGDFVAYLPVVVKPPEDEATAICLSSDGRELIVGLGVGRILVYDATSGKERGELEGFAKPVHSIAISADDQRLLAVDQSGAVRAWRRAGATWQMDRPIQFGDGAAEAASNSFYISSAGEYVASVNGQSLEVWDGATGAQLSSPRPKPGWTIRNASFDVPNRRLAASFVNPDDDSVGWALWDIDTAKLLHHEDIPSLGNTYVNGIDFAQQGGRLAIGFDEALIVYEMENYQRTNFLGFDSTKVVAFSPTNPFLAATNVRGWITVWNSMTNRPVATLHNPRRRVSRDNLVFSADGARLASSNADFIQVWDLARPDEKTVMVGHEAAIPCAVFQSDGRLLATGGKDFQVRFWDPTTGQMVQSLRLPEKIQTLAFSADDKHLAIGCMGRTGAPRLRLLDVASNQVIYETSPEMGNVHSLAWAKGSGGDYLAGCGAGGVALWEVDANKPPGMKEVFKLKRNWCLATVVNPQADMMIWAEGDDSRLRAWDILKGQEAPLNSPPMLQGWHGVAFLPDGESIIYITKAGIAQVWDVKHDRSTDSFGEAGAFDAQHIALSPDGQWFAALTQPDIVSVWHLPTKHHVFSLRPETGTIWSLAWDPSSEHLAVGQSDGGLAVWHLPKIRRELAEAGLPWEDHD